MSDHDHQESPLEQRVLDASAAGCEESRLLISRRALLGLSSSFFAWTQMPRIARAAAPGTEPRLMVVLLRGAVDGLSIAHPNDTTILQSLESMRRGLIGNGNPPLPLRVYVKDLPLEKRTNTGFSLHPSFKNFYKLFNEGDAAIIHAIAPPRQSRSHFHCMDNLESGFSANSSNARSGWLARVLNALPTQSQQRLDVSGLNLGPTPLTILGANDIVSWTNDGWNRSNIQTKLMKLYEDTDTELHDLFRESLRYNQMALGAGSPEVDPKADNWTEENPKLRSADDLKLETTFRGAARLLNQAAGPRIGVLDTTGWDTHTTQGDTLQTKFSHLDKAINGFRAEMSQDVWNKTVVVFVTEFGRSVAINGTGTDHGVGTVALLMGGAVKGGEVRCDFPGVSTSELHEGRDLRATFDTRELFKGLVHDHLQFSLNHLNTVVFPGSADKAPLQDLLKTPSNNIVRPA
jgi:uncharacterized protein (DUF1501 family)